MAQPSPEPWKAPAWLQDWSIQAPVPATLAEVQRAIMATERALEPIDNDRLGSGLARLLNVCNPPTNSPKWPEIQQHLREWWIGTDQDPGAKPVYVAALKDLPLDLLQRACIEVVKTHRGYHKMPSVADLRAHVADDLAERNLALLRLRTAAKKLRALPPPSAKPKPIEHEMTPEQRERYDAIMARVGRKDAA